MKTLHILKTEPDDNTKAFIAALGGARGKESSVFELFCEQVDYEKLIDLIFEHDRVISWW